LGKGERAGKSCLGSKHPRRLKDVRVSLRNGGKSPKHREEKARPYTRPRTRSRPKEKNQSR